MLAWVGDCPCLYFVTQGKMNVKKAMRDEWQYLVFGVLGVAYVVLCYFDLFHFTVCPSKLIFHIPCPSCGSTRALLKVLHGDVWGGIVFNPNVLLLIGIIIFLPIGFWLRHTRCPDIFKRVDRFILKPYVLIPFALMELAIWIRNLIEGI